MISWRFKWFRIINCFQTTWALAQLFKTDYKYIEIYKYISINDEATDGQFLDLHFETCFRKFCL